MIYDICMTNLFIHNNIDLHIMRYIVVVAYILNLLIDHSILI